MTRLINILACVVAAVFMVPLVLAQSAQEKRDGDVSQRLKLDADDLADATSLNVYKFRVSIAKGQKFRAILREMRKEGDEPHVLHHESFLKEQDGPTIVRLAFLRSDQKLAGFLLSEDKQGTYRISCSGCSPGGIVTIIPAPLLDIPPTRKILFVSNTARDLTPMGITGFRLITIVAKEPGQPASSLKAFPRAEFILELEK